MKWIKEKMILFVDFWLSDFKWYRDLQPNYYWYKATGIDHGMEWEAWFKSILPLEQLKEAFERIKRKLENGTIR